MSLHSLQQRHYLLTYQNKRLQELYKQPHTHRPHQGLFDSSLTMHHGAVLARASLRDGPQRGL